MNHKSEIIKTLGHKLGLTSPVILSKAEELHRLLSMRGVKGLTASAESVICLQLAATLAGETCDKAACVKLSGLSGPCYRSQVITLGQLLGVQPQVTIHDLAVTHSALSAECLAESVVQRYYVRVPATDTSQPLCQSVALLAAAKQLGVKVDAKRLHESSGVSKTVFDALLQRLKVVAAEISDENKLLKGNGKSKRNQTLMDLIEDNIAADGEAAKNKKAVHNEEKPIKHSKSDTDEDTEYEEWKRKILLEADQP